MGKGSQRTTVPVHGSRNIGIGLLQAIEKQTGVKLTGMFYIQLKSHLMPQIIDTLLHFLYEVHGTYVEAARREKRFKNWCRQWKLNLIESLNPDWRDLYEDICR